MVAFTDQEWQHFLSRVKEEDGLALDLGRYKREQVERRVQGFLAKEGFVSLAELAAGLSKNAALRRRLNSYITVHVSEFFRDPPYWQKLLGFMGQGGWTRGRVWSAGCSWGAEPVTFWLMAKKAGYHWKICATDTDPVVLEQAAAMQFSRRLWTPALEPYREYVRFPDAETWTVVTEARQDIQWARHNLLNGAMGQTFDLILCRYVLIYFAVETRQRVLRELLAALKPGGILFIGATETLLEAASLGLSPLTPSIFQRISPG